MAKVGELGAPVVEQGFNPALGCGDDVNFKRAMEKGRDTVGTVAVDDSQSITFFNHGGRVREPRIELLSGGKIMRPAKSERCFAGFAERANDGDLVFCERDNGSRKSGMEPLPAGASSRGDDAIGPSQLVWHVLCIDDDFDFVAAAVLS